jgi:hypothetical protein
MSRKTTLLVAVGLCSIGLVLVARAESPATEETLTLTAVKTESGSAIRVTVDDVTFVVPRIAFEGQDKRLSPEITVKDGKLWVPGVGVGQSAGLTGSISMSEMTIKLHPKAPQK